MARRLTTVHRESNVFTALDRRDQLASAGGPPGVPKGKRRATKPKRRSRKKR